MKNKFTLFGVDYAYTYFTDNVSRYNFGAKYYIDGLLFKDTTIGQYWHRIGFGLYYRSDSWLRQLKANNV